MSLFNDPLLREAIQALNLPDVGRRVLGPNSIHSPSISRTTQSLLLESNASDTNKLIVTLLAGIINQTALLSDSVKTIESDINMIKRAKVDRYDVPVATLKSRIFDLELAIKSLPEEVAKAIPAPPPPPPPAPPIIIKQPAPAAPPIRQTQPPLPPPQTVQRQPVSYAAAAKNGSAKQPKKAAKKPKASEEPTTKGNTQKEKALPTAARRFFATRTNPAPIPDAEKLTATLPTLFGQMLAKNYQVAPVTSLSVSINTRGTITVLAHPTVPTTVYAPFFEAMTVIVNQYVNTPDNPHLNFQPAPTNVELAIHGIPLFDLKTEEALQNTFPESIQLATGVTPHSVRFLNKDTNARNAKATSTVVISVTAEDAGKFGPTIRLFSRPRKCMKMWAASNKTQCRNCCQFGHATPACKNKIACAICSLPHDLNTHRCPVTSCPGAKWPQENCCDVSVAKCVNCQGPHRSFNPACPVRLQLLKQIIPTPPPPAHNPLQPMDTA